MRKSNELQAAYVYFAHAVGSLLESKGATHEHGVYTIATPGGPLTIRPSRNWLFCRFANPLGGFIVTRGLSQQHSGKWNTNFADDADTLKAESVLAGFEFDLDQVLAFELTDELREAVRVEGEIRKREAAKLDAFIEDCQSGDPANVEAWLGPNPKVTAENWQHRHAKPHVAMAELPETD